MLMLYGAEQQMLENEVMMYSWCDTVLSLSLLGQQGHLWEKQCFTSEDSEEEENRVKLNTLPTCV